MVAEHNRYAVALVTSSDFHCERKPADYIHLVEEQETLNGYRAGSLADHIRSAEVRSATGSCTDQRRNHYCTRAQPLVLAVASTSCCYLDG